MQFGPNGKQMAALLLGAAVGCSLLVSLASWTSSSKEGHKLLVLTEKVEAMVDGQARIEAETKALRSEIRLAVAAAPIMLPTTAASHPEQGHYSGDMPIDRSDAQALPDMDSEKTDNKIMLSKNVVSSDQEAELVNPIIEKLRANSSDAYPNLPSLMSSPEMAALSPAGRDKVMGEISRMLENGELDQAVFFPKQ